MEADDAASSMSDVSEEQTSDDTHSFITPVPTLFERNCEQFSRAEKECTKYLLDERLKTKFLESGVLLLTAANRHNQVRRGAGGRETYAYLFYLLLEH